MYKLIRALLFLLPPETIHLLTLRVSQLVSNVPPLRWTLEQWYQFPQKPVQAFGLTFKNPVGLAAGYDKDGIAISGLSTLGFGHIEVGTVTPRSQSGNPKPRIFRLVEEEAIINRMGFPSKGAEFVLRRLSSVSDQRSTVLGLNLGKNKDTPLEEAAGDYLTLMRTFTPLADYLAINISSPNTVGLRRLQGREMLESLLGQIAAERQKSEVSCPILVKLSPDLTDDELDHAIGVILDKGMDGIIATNTTIAREGLPSMYREVQGGLSGRPLKVASEAILERTIRLVNSRIPVVSVGGIMSSVDAKRRLDMGAALVQIYTGLIYHGPGYVREIVKGLGTAS